MCQSGEASLVLGKEAGAASVSCRRPAGSLQTGFLNTHVSLHTLYSLSPGGTAWPRLVSGRAGLGQGHPRPRSPSHQDR